MYGSFYRRPLPQPPAIAFSSRAGREIFARSLRHGYMERFFPLCEQFRTQEEPSFCGISTLAMVLNAMGQDPGRVWKGPWRYYHEDMLTCCVPLSVVKSEGITFRQLECLARCNGASVKSYQSQEPNVTLDLFRELVMKSTSEGGDFLIVSYGRTLLGQTGDGHFSPIGGYDPEHDLVLILDVARFKYPPHWVELKLLFEATKLVDPSTGRSRGFMVLSKRNLGHSIYFLISQRTQSWHEFMENVKKTLAPLCCSVHASCDDTEDGESIIACITKRFSKDVVDMFSTYINEFSLNYVSEDHMNNVNLLLDQLRSTRAFRIVSKFQHLIPASSVPGIEILTILLLALPRSTWEDEAGTISPFARYFVMDSMPEPLNNEVLAIRFQLEALLQYCNYAYCIS